MPTSSRLTLVIGATLSLAGLAGCAGKHPEPAATAVAPVTSTASYDNPQTNPSAASNATTAATPDAAAYRTIVDAPDRTPEDRALDVGRQPVELLQFLGVQPGMRVAEISAGGGYTTELLARAVAPNGVVYAQNSRFILERFAEKPWSERLARPVMKAVVRVDRNFDDPLPPEATNLDLVIDNLFYHDTVWMKTDRDRMNRSIYAALRPGGAYVVVDHSGRSGTGTSEALTLHRIEEQIVRDEVQRVGFRLAAEGTFLRNPNDTRDWSASPRVAGARRGTSDRFVLRFVKP
jgi:predicted methyltransferase